MTATQILEFFFSKAPWINRETTVDRVIVGDGNKPVQRVLVTWMPSLAAVKAAIDGKYDLLLTHEPTFYDHRDYRDNPDDMKKVETSMKKRKLIEDAGLVIVRNHDVWDLFPDIGIPFAWAKHLGFEAKPVQIGGGRYMHRYDMEPLTLETFAKQVAARVAALGEDAVEVFGEPGTMVSKVGVGTGCATQPATFQFMGCDVSIVSDDGTSYWKQLQQAKDEGHPFIRVSHGVSEEPGMVTLADYLREQLPQLEVKHLPHVPFYRTVTAQGPVAK